MSNKRVIIDVRSEFEFMMDHAEGSINIPLEQIPTRIEEIRGMDNPILCCVSGGRSAQAVHYLQALGIDCENGGCWFNF